MKRVFCRRAFPRTCASIAVASIAILAAASAPEASAATISGQITCVANPPVGAWQAVNSGVSGWVSWSPFSGTNTIHYSRSFSGTSWSLHVGCGGTKQRWALTAYTSTYRGGGVFNFTCYDIRNAGWAYKSCQRT